MWVLLWPLLTRHVASADSSTLSTSAVQSSFGLGPIPYSLWQSHRILPNALAKNQPTRLRDSSERPHKPTKQERMLQTPLKTVDGPIAGAPSQTPGRIQKEAPPEGSTIYTIGVFEPRLGGSPFWILPEVWVKWVKGAPLG